MSSTDSSSEHGLTRILLTAGEPAGIGPDLIAMAAQRRSEAQIVAVADPRILTERARQLDLPLKLVEFTGGHGPQQHRPGTLQIIPLTAPAPVSPGRPDTANAGYVLESIHNAATACLDGAFDAMVTPPVNKSVLSAAGIPFTGHTEYIATLCGDFHPVMMLQNDRLRVVLVTTHLPLKDVSAAITKEKLSHIIRTAWQALQTDMGIRDPRLSVCGLNPHAGEGGYLGHEEQETIQPVLETLRSEGLQLTGPLPADTAFTRQALEQTDAVIAMYHDQGLPVLKSQGFGDSVNITLGLPIVRTSVDHGTACDLAGTGRASDTSLAAAINCAIQLARHRRRRTD